uniref:peptidylprolyl isomerase n=1 Tax=Helicotheca tamesis TaxID=374047 RepID=A0A7S2H4F6_9STRA|mmetsp:Transcript_15163/g.20680  ORF Transcript_15163/g.20680 Transcript_15163/m.20680 type:complete len:207 (+) Transcript_15163:72-692(+)|eukprot:CAMPEP_0185729272 /NCGR_PEP_ID=MMETSP1171-20130828/5006_1 /TAXON_ID=374046 /ORGANISM="Helicotheca tamensis, Strain CCMP826" /LENGTH=206 /DNA_ID=CAMNT_0028398069 /DNA_START=49 /DNA_END=669 /DNA_ORIENTATION=-
MRFSCVLAAALFGSATALETKVTVYEGPTECSDEEKVAPGQHLSMHYTGKIDESSEAGEKGKVFDSSRDRGDPFTFQIGGGRVIVGWDQGLLGLCKGAKATLVIPPDEGYGDAGAGGVIPGGATLNFDVEVLDILDEGDVPAEPNVFTMIDTDGDGKLSPEEVLNFFKSQGAEDVPEGLWENEDKDEDGFISWEEFSGPKGSGEEL